jgi:hypothetical protein
VLRTPGDSGSVAALPALGTHRTGIETMNMCEKPDILESAVRDAVSWAVQKCPTL